MTHRDRRGRFTYRDATARAIEICIDRWIVAGIDRDTDDEVMAVAG